MQKSCLSLLQSVADLDDALIVIFKGEDVQLTNRAFNKFFGVISTEEYKESFGAFVHNFVPHPYYFHAQNVKEGELWYDAILALDEIDRVVSFLSYTHNPHAFSVSVYEDIDSFTIVTFTDITQMLIKRIMTSNKTNIDSRTGAYTKQYFLHIKESFEEAASFNEKLIGLINIELSSDANVTQEDMKESAIKLQETIRNDDMLIKWSEKRFLLAFLVDDATKVQQVERKLKEKLTLHERENLSFSLSSVAQKRAESIAAMINKLDT